MITIRGINGDILTHFDNNVPEGNPYFEPVMTDDMESLVSSFSFSVPLELADTEHLVGLNQVLVKDRQEDLRLFVITDVHEVWTTVGGTLQVTCEDISINEMNNIIVSPFESLNFQDTLTKTFNNSGWALKYGANWKDVDNTTFKVENYDNMRSVIASIVDTYGCQFKFMAQENQFGEITRVAEVYKSRGNNTGKYFYYDRDLLGIERDINHAEIKTAIHPYYTGYDGKTYSLKGFAPANPDPDFKKDKASPLIINREASKLFDDGNSYRIMPYKTEVEGNPELVYREAIKELKKYAEPIYTYSVNVLLLQNMIGWEGEGIDLGDTVWMKERVGNRELGLEARVTAYEYHEDDPSKDVVTFSNFKEIDTTDVPELAERIFVAYANSEDGTIDFSISDSVGKAYMGVYTAAVSTQSTDPSTYSWTRIKGEDGVSAPTLNLTSSQQVMKFNSNGTPDGDQTIIFTALKQNSTETVTWEAIPYKGDIAQPTITLGGTGDVRSLSSADWNNEWTRVKVTVSMGSLKDTQTVVMVSDGATGASGKAIVGYVTNESTTFAASSDGTVTDYGNGDGKFVLYEGTNEVTSGVTFARVSQVGINLLINDITGVYKVSNMTADMAQASVSATYKGITITKFLSFSKSKQGAKGDKGDTGNDGIAGKDGIGLKSTTVTYAASASGTTAPSTGWQEQVPTVAPDNFLWTRTVWTYTDETSETGYSVAKMGRDGAKGNDGIAGKDGVGIADTLIEYAVNTSGTVRPTSGWSTNTPSVPAGQYLWTRTTWNYTDNTSETGYSVARMGADGETSHMHTAYAWSADGTDRFTKVYPNENLFVKSRAERTGSREFVNSSDWDMAPIIDKYGVDREYSVSFDLKSKVAGVIDLYSQNGSGTRYDIGYINIQATTEYKRYSHTFRPTASNMEMKQAMLAFYGTYNSGRIPSVKNVKFELGNKVTIDTPSPKEDYVNAYPTYTGTYSDFNVKGSDNPKDYTWARSMGNDGTDGAPAKALTLQADSPVMKFDANDVVVAGQVITFTAIKQNFDSNIAWVATPYKGNTAQPAIALKGTGDVRTLEASMWASGVTTIRVDVSADSFRDSVTITKVKDGAKGDRGSDGVAGKDGVGIRSTAITYAGSASGTTPPTAGWQTQVPTVSAGQFLWTKTVWTYTDNSTETGYSAAMMGKNGAKGDDGIAGKDGVGIKNTVIEYAANTSGTVKPTSGWTSAVPNTPQGQYLWTRTTWTYTDNTTEQGFTVARQGANGANGNDGVAGKDGVGLRSTSITYAGSTSGTTPPSTGWNTQVPTVPAGQFLWTKTIWTYTDASSETGYSVAKMGQDGAKGNDGIAGKDGVGIKTTLVEYAANTSGTVKPTSGWSTSIPNTPAGQYLWTRTTWTYTDNTTEQGYIVARQGANGTNGTNGTNGIDAYSAILSNEANTFAANPAGAVTDWSTGRGTFMVYKGTTRLTSGVTYAVASSVDATGTINATTGDYTVTALAKDNGSITFKATIGSTVLTKTMSLSKARQGVQGVQGTMGIAFYSPTEPTGANVKEGSTWFKTVSTADNTIAGIYTYKGGKWVKTEVASGALSVEKLSALSADLGDVTAGNITGVNITGASFVNPFDFTDVSMNHFKGTTEIADAEIGLEGIVNEGTAGARKFVNSITPAYFQSVHKAADGSILRSVNTSSSGIILNDSNVTTSFDKDGLRVVDMPRNASSWSMSTRIGLTRGSDGSTMEILPSGPVHNNHKNIYVTTGTGDLVSPTPNNARLRFANDFSYGWGMMPEDNPIVEIYPYLWQVNRKIKFEITCNINAHDVTSDYVYYALNASDVRDTDKSPKKIVILGRLSAAPYPSPVPDTRMPLQNSTFCRGIVELEANWYFSVVAALREGKNGGRTTIMSTSIREIF